ncbi:STAS domain-containing protein [Methanocalculus taiwanensis]|uniref:STAS domain-containing protein n=1 Tax=Methanocalculus taiwanensis TaxID=106207 RepID=A0ABD4TL82_9EURY|nr:STAS domain-containing protein [Methanocalculus taiwanensis]MCQ1538065.1 STAS domain-containing protein [Methanocalculus taiwanensis]
MMEITIADSQGVRFADVSGRIDSKTAPEVENILRSFTGEQEGNVIVNCSGLEYISSGGLRALLIIEKEMKGSGRHLILCGLRTDVEKIFRLTGFTSIFTIEKTVGDAIEHLR